VVIVYDVGMVLALLIGAAIGLLVTAAHYERIALRRWAYEREMAERREFYAALGAFRRIKPDDALNDEHRRRKESPKSRRTAPVRGHQRTPSRTRQAECDQ
jgi:hypothetical protein